MKLLKWLAVGLFAILFLIILWVMTLHWRNHNESTHFNEQVMQQAPGDYVKLTAGQTHYQRYGSSGDWVVLVHGFSIPATAWGDIPSRLAEQGFQVLTFDLYGRGYSERPDIPYTGALYEQQVIELLNALNINDPVHIVGLSMGGAVATRAAAQHPERFARVGLVAPLHEPILPPGIPAGLGYYMVSAFYIPMLEQGLEDESVSAEITASLVESYQHQREIRGFTRALTSSIYNFTPDNHSRFYQQLRDQQKPVWLAWGTADTTVPFVLNEAVRSDAGVLDRHFEVFEGAGHMPHLEHPVRFSQALSAFLHGN